MVRRSVIGVSFTSEPEICIAQRQQDFGDAAHADASDADEMEVLGPKKHFLIVLFRRFGLLSIEMSSFPYPP